MLQQTKQQQGQAWLFTLMQQHQSLPVKLVFIPNRTFLVRFGEFGRAVLRILARRRRGKLPMARSHVRFILAPLLGRLFPSPCRS